MAAHSSSPVFFSYWKKNAPDDGGHQRTQQMLEALEPLGYEARFSSAITAGVQGSRVYRFFGRLRLDEAFMRCLVHFDRARGWQGWERGFACKTVVPSWFIARQWAKALADGKGIGLAIVENPLFSAPLLRRLDALGIPAVGVCQNLEARIGGHVLGEWRDRLCAQEMKILAACALVITVSESDAREIVSHGGCAYCFAPFPPRQLLSRLRQVRQRRAETAKRDYLALGSAFHPPTYTGMGRLIEAWRTMALSERFGRLVVAGYESERLARFCDGRHTLCRGTLAAAELDALLAETRGCICYQEEESGALMRISSLLTAGVSVIANPIAARGYTGQNGVWLFDAFTQLPETLSRAAGGPQVLPAPQPPDPGALLEAIRAVRDKALR